MRSDARKRTTPEGGVPTMAEVLAEHQYLPHPKTLVGRCTGCDWQHFDSSEGDHHLHVAQALAAAGYGHVASVEGERDELREALRIGLELDNHHNAARCPYCRPQRDDYIARAERAEAQVAAVRAALDTWQMGESRYHTVRAIDADLRATLDKEAGR